MKRKLLIIFCALLLACQNAFVVYPHSFATAAEADGSVPSDVVIPDIELPDLEATSQPVVNPLPTEVPSDEPAPITPAPEEEPVFTAAPTTKPTAVPTTEPTTVPTAEPTAIPTDEPAPVTPAPEEEPVLTAEPQPTVNPLPTAVPTTKPTAEPECTHNFVRIIDSVSSTYVNQNEQEHSVDVVCHDRCTLCGAETASRRETILEAHNFSDKGHIEGAHRSGLGHAYYDLCVCGAAQYTGYYGSLDSCKMCKPTSGMNDNGVPTAKPTAAPDGKFNWKENHAPVDKIFQETPTEGNIRYVSQYSGDTCYYKDYWTGVANPGGKCTWAAHSMMLSYFGVDVLPADIQSKMTELSTGKYLAAINALIADTNITSVRAVDGHEESAIDNGIKKGAPVGNNGTVWVADENLQENNMYDRLHEMYDNYSTDSSYSPIMMYMWRHRGKDKAGNDRGYGPHAIVIIGQDPDDEDVFYIANPGDTRQVYKMGFRRDDQGILRVDASKSAGLANDSNAVIELCQYKR